MNNSVIDNSSGSDIFSSGFLLGNLGAPFILGMAVGYFAKKMFRLALFFGGAIVVLLFVAEYYGVITVSDAALQTAASSAATAAKESGSFLIDRLSVITSRGVSGGAGFFVGFKLG
ncbi:FUN14 domain-containing protein [Methylomonas sp. AM2-LC]|uniref:FUN14 domain-containing protein n=1 Tax=Methylomonas sp. AM2-LC TaxID=3153301 RepID=UPI0032648D89